MRAQQYEIRVQGALSAALAEVFTPWHIATEQHGTVTVISGTITDQADLSGVLQTVDLLGLDLLEIRPRTVASGG